MMNFRHTVILLLFLFQCGLLSAETFYVSTSSGSDFHTGRSPRESWRSTDRVNEAGLGPGDSVLFRCGDTWTYEDGDYLRLRSGSDKAPVYYGSFGKGKKPVLSRYRPANDPVMWIDQGEHIWKFHAFAPGFHFNTSFISYNNDEVIGRKCYGLDELQQQGDFYTDRVQPDPSDKQRIENYTYVYSLGNPAEVYFETAIVIGESGIAADTDFTSVENIVIHGLSFYRCGWNGIGIPHSGKNILVDECDIGYCGAQQHLNTDVPRTRRGQCINTQGDIENFEVRNCLVYQGWDGGIALQGWRPELRVKDVWIHHNIFMQNEFAFEFWGVQESSRIENVHFENNTCLLQGYGWAYGHVKKHKRYGASIFSWTFNGEAKELFIRNNIFYCDRAPSFYIWSARNNKWKTAIHCDYNLYYSCYGEDATENERAFWFTDYQPRGDGNWQYDTEDMNDLYTAAEWGDWKTATGFDLHSLVAIDPGFTTEARPSAPPSPEKLRLKKRSPARGFGLTMEKYVGMRDRWGNEIGQEQHVGAYQGR